MRPYLRPIAAAFFLRLALALFFHFTGVWSIDHFGAMTPDELVNHRAALALIEDPTRDAVRLIGSAHTLWLWVTVILYSTFSPSLLVLRLANNLIGTALVPVAASFGRSLGGPRTARTTAWATALFPTLVVWSALTLREPLVLLFIMIALAVAGRLFVEPDRRGAIPLALSIAAPLCALLLLRTYMSFLTGLTIGVAALMVTWSQRITRPLLIALLAGGLAVTTALSVAPLRHAALLAVGLVAHPDGSAMNPLSAEPETGWVPAPAEMATELPELEPGRGGTDTKNSSQSIREKGLGRALAIAVLGGRPVWRTAEFYFALQPGVVLWWAALPAVVAGAVLSWRRSRAGAWTLSVGFTVSVMLLLAATGLFIRHHAMLEPPALVLASRTWARWPDLTDLTRRSVIASTAVMVLGAAASVAESLSG